MDHCHAYCHYDGLLDLPFIGKAVDAHRQHCKVPDDLRAVPQIYFSVDNGHAYRNYYWLFHLPPV